MYNSEWVDSLILRLHAPIVDTAEIDIDEDTRRYGDIWQVEQLKKQDASGMISANEGIRRDKVKNGSLTWLAGVEISKDNTEMHISITMVTSHNPQLQWESFNIPYTSDKSLTRFLKKHDFIPTVLDDILVCSQAILVHGTESMTPPLSSVMTDGE